MKIQTLTTRALAGTLAHNLFPTIRNSSPNFAGISARQTGLCDLGYLACGDGCMPVGSKCCGLLNPGSCSADYNCTSEGCCPVGEFCTGEATGCQKGYVMCGDGCIPSTATCCPNGGYCDADEVCTSSGRCEKGSGGTSGGGTSGGNNDGGNSGSDTGSFGGSVNGTCSATQVECGGGCMPNDGSMCCSSTLGEYCEAGYYCVSGGCCKLGKVCGGNSGSSSSDDDDEEEVSGFGSGGSSSSSSSGSSNDSGSRSAGGRVSIPVGGLLGLVVFVMM